MKIIFVGDVSDFIYSLSDETADKIMSSLESLRLNRVSGLKTKTLQAKIRELIVDQYRIVFFIKEEVIYAIDAFKKQSQKTPLRIIRRAMKIYKSIQTNE